ncbi:hypothetical protein ACFQT0_19550 [Hymenobacter humi]|uniref:Uncharacterized protein n=1 Tax=Hymenobacter humi TaxID=1411620 RepID=A0ABW2U771_9BACT
MRNRALYPAPFSGKVIDKGNFYPSAVRTAEVAQYEAYTHGALICWNMTTYYGGDWGLALNQAGGVPAPAPCSTPKTWTWTPGCASSKTWVFSTPF